MTAREIATLLPDLDPGRISDLGIDSIDELSAMAVADPDGFATYFYLKDAKPLIHHLQELLDRANESFEGPFVRLPPSGVPFENWPPADHPALSPDALAERDRLVEKIRLLETLPANDAEARRSLVEAVVALRRLVCA